ncbi:hypothetical protein [Microbacterium capsulatum]|uniref:Uncharacterized protein n=1 Tax=Microbacterium capsulatum TaxID=3041921 RepID=A0ABU0XDV8_9MICO|nr:hypothetical protein [Microbacterium sp. ASV81]MDQ4213301.1 hypothetical protein [Microbacterium sp. ASV81]
MVEFQATALAELGIDLDGAGGDGGPGGAGGPQVPAPPGPPPRPLKAKAKKKVHRRRQSSIRAYIGPNGSGKTALMVMDVLPVLDGQYWRCSNPAHLHTQRGETEGWRRVLSTVQLYDERTGLPHPLCDRLTEWTQVLEAEHCDILFDEVTGIAGSRESMGMPVVVQNKLNQLRRADTPMSWSAPSWSRADSIIRSCTQLVTDCRGWLPDRKLLRGDAPPAWLPKRLFKARSFAAVDFDEWTAAKASQDKGAVRPLRPSVVQWWWGPRSRVFASYDTYDAVSRVGDVLDGGRCAHCGGRRSVPVCRCDK